MYVCIQQPIVSNNKLLLVITILISNYNRLLAVPMTIRIDTCVLTIVPWLGFKSTNGIAQLWVDKSNTVLHLPKCNKFSDNLHSKS